MTETALIAGGGIAGLATSIALQNAGLRTRVLEAKPQFEELGVAVVIAPNGVKALRALGRGIEDAVIDLGRVIPNPRIRVLDPRGALRNNVEFGAVNDLYGAPQVVILRRDLHSVLLGAHGPEGLEAGRAIVAHRPHGDHVDIAMADGHHEEAELLIGADGINSTVRRPSDPTPPRSVGFGSVRGLVPPDVVPSEGLDGLSVMEHHDHVMFMPLTEGRYYFSSAFEVDPGSWPADPEEARQRVLERIRGWYLMEDVVRSGFNLVSREIRDRAPALTWSDERVTLVGDAAHPMGNFWGQGANTALEDAVVLARCLGLGGHSLGERLARYDTLRIPRTRRLIEMSSRVDTHLGDPAEFLRWTYEYDALTVDLYSSVDPATASIKESS